MKKRNFKSAKKRLFNLDLLDNAYNKDINVIKFSKHETFEHFLAKCLLCYELIQIEHDFVTEAIFKNNKRADIFDLTEGEALEVLKSETNKYFETKTESYPVEIRPFKAQKIIDSWKKHIK